jgi:osmotically-inducible protein OsmY
MAIAMPRYQARRNMSLHFKCALGALVLSGAMLLEPIPMQAMQNPGADNTRANKQDRDKSRPTADQATNQMSDREMMQHIRKDVVGDKSLSTYAHNVKIIARSGKVTLRGPVHSEEEKRAIEEHARRYAGDGNVTNEITVKEDQGHKDSR